MQALQTGYMTQIGELKQRLALQMTRHGVPAVNDRRTSNSTSGSRLIHSGPSHLASAGVERGVISVKSPTMTYGEGAIGTFERSGLMAHFGGLEPSSSKSASIDILACTGSQIHPALSSGGNWKKYGGNGRKIIEDYLSIASPAHSVDNSVLRTDVISPPGASSEHEQDSLRTCLLYTTDAADE